jgi:hypothetical protein
MEDIINNAKKKTLVFSKKMLTRKRQRDTEIQNRFNVLTATQSNQFHPILESIANFLGFKDVSNVAKLSVEYHLKTWIHVLKSKNRNIREPIVINYKCMLWLTKYSKSLENQHLEFSKIIDKNVPEIPKVDTLSLIRRYGYDGKLPECKTLHLSDSGEFPNLTNFEKLFLRSGCQKANIFLEFLSKASDSLKELYIYWGIHGLPMLPHLEVLYYKDIGAPKGLFQHLSKLCPNLKELYIKYYHQKTCKSLLGLNISKLTLESYDLRDISDLKYLPLQELDVTKCRNIQDFSAVSHIPNFRKRSTKSREL